jgi:sarcosine/dimethylglycine N-methyltransferase
MTATPSPSDATAVARNYYNSEDADGFYTAIWGGQDIHIGLYDSDETPIAEASQRTVAHMASALEGLGATSRVLDIGSGYGGAARFLARTFGCRVVGLNLSDVENARARALNAEEGLQEQIEIIDGSFQDIPFPDASFDAVWSQDAILHSDDRTQVLREVVRVLKPGGLFSFTDPMQSDDCPDGVLQPILDRIHLQSLGSAAFYRRVSREIGLEEEAFEELTPHLIAHYGRVLRETEAQTAELSGRISPAYLERMKAGLRHWIEGGEQGYLTWGIFRFRKA